MRAQDIDFFQLLSVDPEGGILRSAGERAVVLDATALGILRRELYGTLGPETARGMLTRLGFAHGFRAAETLQSAFPWDSPQEWRNAGSRTHRLQGMVLVEAVPHPAGEPHAPFAEALWRESYEAEQHLLHLGQADQCVCFTLCGFASGYMSFVNQRDVFAHEVECVGRGDAVCRMVARFREDFAPEELTALLPYYQSDCLSSSLQRVTIALREAERKLSERKARLVETGFSPIDAAGLVARSDGLRRALELARRAARVESPVLVAGESGVGKERVARIVHQESARKTGPFLAINCGAVPETLIESELFGHARGAFTGAIGDRVGLFEAANGGTLFLDEVGELPLHLQPKLLRVLQEREVRRLGETKPRPIDARIVAATNRDLAREVEQGTFRRDLYYRLRVIEILIPPLRQRKDDILPLARALLARMAERTERTFVGFTPAAADLLLRYPFPGNVRELENAIERAVAFGDGPKVEVADLPEEIRSFVAENGGFEGRLPDALREGQPLTLADVEQAHILAVLAAEGGNRTKAAQVLGIGIATLHRKLRQYGVKARAIPLRARPSLL
jgi:two-component system, NtrC family, response regulator HydG